MTGIEMLREYARTRLTSSKCKEIQTMLGKTCDDFQTCNECHTVVCDAIADQIEREIEEVVADEVVDTLSAYEMDADAKWCSVVEKGAKSDYKAEYELISRYWLPRPRFEDGEPVQFGDEFVAAEDTHTVFSIEIYKGCGFMLSSERCVSYSFDEGERVKRPEPTDSWERIEADAKKGPCAYYGRAPFDCTDEDGGECRVLNTDDCNECMALEIVRRCKALAGVE